MNIKSTIPQSLAAPARETPMAASIRPASATDVDPAVPSAPADPTAAQTGFGQMLKSRITSDGKADGKADATDSRSHDVADDAPDAAPVDASALASLAAWAATLAPPASTTAGATQPAGTTTKGGIAASAGMDAAVNGGLAGVSRTNASAVPLIAGHGDATSESAVDPTELSTARISPKAVTDAVGADQGAAADADFAALRGAASRWTTSAPVSGVGSKRTVAVAANAASPARNADTIDKTSLHDAVAAAVSADARQSVSSSSTGLDTQQPLGKSAELSSLGEVQANGRSTHQAVDATPALSTAGLASTPSIATSVDPATTPVALTPVVGTAAWSHDLGQVTVQMAAGDLQSASLRLNPEHLGPIDVQVRVDNGVANLTFNAAHAETRQAIEGSRAVLDQMFAQQGLTVGDCSVGDSSRQAGQAAWADSQSRTPGREASNAATRETDAPTPVASIAAVRSTASSGRVDIFA